MEFDLINYLILIIHALSFIVVMATPFYITDTTLCYFETLKTKTCWKTMTEIDFINLFLPI